jgi:hypothetical protein
MARARPSLVHCWIKLRSNSANPDSTVYISVYDVALDLVYSAVVAIVIAVLFGIDYLYRHFA